MGVDLKQSLALLVAALLVAVVGVSIVLFGGRASSSSQPVVPYEYARIAVYCGLNASSISFGYTSTDAYGRPFRVFETPVGEATYFANESGICPDGTTFPR